jgi:mannose/cellobiose epimerase-like protein (N-acyl-D-glucosamine 2-epimerase family)
MKYEGPRWITTPSHRQWLIGHAFGLFDFYADAAVNPRGGFFDLDETGRPLPTGWPPAAKPTRNLFQTTRMVHCYALGHLFGYPGAWRALDHGMKFLWDGHRDPSHGGYCWSNGYREVTDGGKQLYGHAFVLLAAASAKVAGHPDADRVLDDVAQVIAEHFWEDPPGAGIEEFQMDWTPVQGYRGQNGNMHLTEALMAAADATGEHSFLEKARSIATLLISQKAANNFWRLPEHYHQDWSVDFDYGRDVFRPYGSTVGHWLEWSHLLIQLWEMTGRNDDWMPQGAKSLFERAVTEGWARDGGGFYFTVDWSGTPVDRDRYWWPETEGIVAAHALANMEPTGPYEAWYRTIWSWCHEHLIDRRYGSWRHQLNADLVPVSDPWFGKPDLYHSLQATLAPLLPIGSSVASALAGNALPTDSVDS